MLRFVCHVAAKVAADNDVPRRAVFAIEFLLDIGRHVLLSRAARRLCERETHQRTSHVQNHSRNTGTHLFNVVFGQCLGGNVHGILLHLLVHVGIFDDGFSLLTHGSIDQSTVCRG